jgi:hypothetical protein
MPLQTLTMICQYAVYMLEKKKVKPHLNKMRLC